MCTVTIVPRPARDAASDSWQWRVVANRDENPGRAGALPPNRQTRQGTTALFPIDPVSRGTWLAATEHGLVLALLNARSIGEPPLAREPARSRGSIVAAVVSGATAEDCLTLARQFDPADFAPFRLLVIDSSTVHLLRGDGRRWSAAKRLRLDRPRMFTSSGLGDELVEGPRGELFARSFARPAGSTVEAASWQDLFHRHTWPQERHLSVFMTRRGARTVSRTIVEVYDERLEMTYQDVGEQPTEQGPVFQQGLPLVRPVIVGPAASGGL